MAATIETAIGPVPASSLGFTLSHEHVLTFQGNDLTHYPWMFNWPRMREVAIEELKALKAIGVDSIIALETPDLSRHAAFVVDVATEANYPVVMATGIWRDVPRSFGVRDIDASADIFVREIEVGIDDTGRKAGVIKVANDENEFTPAHQNVLRAAARACNRTGTPISTHHWAVGKQGLEQVRIFKEEGVQLDRVCIGHSSDTDDVAYLEEMLNMGVFLSLDHYTLNPNNRRPWQERNKTVEALVEKGWAHRLMLGHDGHATQALAADLNEWPNGVGPRGSMTVVTKVAIPGLLADGVTQAQIDQMMIEAPRRFLSGED